MEKDNEKFLLYKMLVVFACNGWSSAPLSQYKNNPIYQEITEEYDFGGTNRDDRIYIDMRRSKGYTDELEKINRDDSGLALPITLKKATAKKLRHRIVGWLQGECWCILCNKGYIMSYKNYNISKSDAF